MFKNLFHKTQEEPRKSNTWKLLQGEVNDMPIIVRINGLFEDKKYRKGKNVKVSIAVPFANTTKKEITQDIREEVLTKIEDYLIESFEENSDGELAVIITNPIMREFVIYKRNNDDLLDKLDLFKSEFDEYVIQFHIDMDPDWQSYESFTP